MIVAAMIGYYVVAFGLIFLVGYVTYRQGVHRLRAASDAATARMRAELGRIPPLEPYVREPLPEPPPPPELRITVARHPDADGDRLPKLAAEMIRAASRLEKEYGGDGLDYDPWGSVEEPARLVLRLVSRSSDWEAADRLAAVAEQLNRLMEQARSGEFARQDTDIRSQIDRELQPHLPSAMIEDVRVATTS